MAPPYPIGRSQMIAAIVILAFSVLALMAAWGFQYIGGYQPCRLCLEQREPFYAAIPIVALTFSLIQVPIMPIGRNCLVRGLFAVVGLFFLFGAVTGLMQAGAEWGIWAAPTDCAGGGAAAMANVQDLMEQIRITKVVPCDKAQIRIIGLSFAGWNVFASGFLALVAIAGAALPGDYGSSSTSQ